MDTPAELVEIRAIAESLGLVIVDLEHPVASFEAYLIKTRVEQHLRRLRREIADLESARTEERVAA